MLRKQQNTPNEKYLSQLNTLSYGKGTNKKRSYKTT